VQADADGSVLSEVMRPPRLRLFRG
jgi:hypothetical protein